MRKKLWFRVEQLLEKMGYFLFQHLVTLVLIYFLEVHKM